MSTVTDPGELVVIGSRPIRHDGPDKVTGRALFGDDFRLPGMLHARILRSPHAHARILAIDTSRAEALPGVLAAVTARDLPPTAEGDLGELRHWNQGFTKLRYLRDNILANEKVLYHGHAVAGVAAVNPHVAEEALELIDVRYEPLPSVQTARQALAGDAPILHSDLRTRTGKKQGDGPTNLSILNRVEAGDAAGAMAESEIVVERELQTATVHQGYIEPHVATVLWHGDGRLRLWTSTQGAFYVREMLSTILGISESDVLCTPMEIGGGFGGKFEQFAEPVAALLSRKTGRPVKVTMSRSDELQASGPAPGAHMKIKLGADSDGKITALEARLAYEAGAFPDTPPVIMGAFRLIGPYDIPNVRIDTLEVVVNKPKSSWFRAPCGPQAIFAMEQVVDELAERLGKDPMELRLNNASRDVARRPGRQSGTLSSLPQILQAMRDHPHYSAPLEAPNCGRGVAISIGGHGGGPSTSTISVNSDGTASLLLGSPDLSGSRVSLAMQAAEVLGIRTEDIRPLLGHSDSVGYNMGSSSSRTTMATGLAACMAAEDVKRQMVQRAATLWGVDLGTLQYDRGAVRSIHDTALTMTFAQLAARQQETGGPIVANAATRVTGSSAVGAGTIVDVHVDPDTGKVDILRCTVVQDAGRAVHPGNVEGQMQGATAQGIGWGLSEGLAYDNDGRLLNPSFLDYRLPTTTDLPNIDPVIVEVPNPTHPFGVRGVGEISLVTPAPAIANAIYAAVGVRMDSMPMDPTTVLSKLRTKSS